MQNIDKYITQLLEFIAEFFKYVAVVYELYLKE